MAKSESKGGPTTEQLLKRMAELEKQYAALQVAVDEKEKKILELEAKTEATGQAAMTMLGRQVAEQYLGKRKVLGKTFNHKKKEFVETEMELDYWEYLIDLPPSGGEGVTINGTQFHHGQVIEVDTNTLRTIKEMVFRAWFHESQIKGNDENKFRRPTNPVFSMKSGRRVA